MAKKKAKKGWKEAEKELEGLPVTTCDFIPGYEIVGYKGYVWGTTVQSRFFGQELIAMIKSLIGGEITQYTHMINHARLGAVHKMVQNAESLGANAIISVRAGSSSVMPGTVEVFCYGTAVEVKPK
jgi:uncharacterized protein YbjQ (UPF0145 family)